MEEVRWHYHFNDFSRAFQRLEEPLKSGRVLNDLERAGVMHRFQCAFKLACKLLEDYLEYSGVNTDRIMPRSVIKEAFAAKLIDDGDDWMDLFDAGSNISDKYDAAYFKAMEEKIRFCFLGLLEQLHQKLSTEIEAG